MRITQWGEYGILCSVFIAERESSGEKTVNATEIAEHQNIPLDYARQILQRLKQNGIIKSIRGPHGGYLMQRPPEEISVLDVLNAAEGYSFEVICERKPLNTSRCTEDGQCRLKPMWFQLREHIDSFLQGYTVAELMGPINGIDQATKPQPEPVQIV